MHVHMIINFRPNHREKYALDCGTYTYLNARDPIPQYPKGINVCGWHSKDKCFNLGPFKWTKTMCYELMDLMHII